MEDTRRANCRAVSFKNTQLSAIMSTLRDHLLPLRSHNVNGLSVIGRWIPKLNLWTAGAPACDGGTPIARSPDQGLPSLGIPPHPNPSQLGVGLMSLCGTGRG